MGEFVSLVDHVISDAGLILPLSADRQIVTVELHRDDGDGGYLADSAEIPWEWEERVCGVPMEMETHCGTLARNGKNHAGFPRK